MKKVISFVLVIASLTSFAQNIQTEINDQVWKPFIASFNPLDTKAFMAVHSKDLIRSPRDSKVILNWDEYFKNQQESDQRSKKSGAKRVIELRFTERISSSSQAIDIGIYKGTVSTNDGKSSSYSYYGRFHVILRKEGNSWKILVDTDSSEKNTIGEKDFLAALPIE